MSWADPPLAPENNSCSTCWQDVQTRILKLVTSNYVHHQMEKRKIHSPASPRNRETIFLELHGVFVELGN